MPRVSNPAPRGARSPPRGERCPPRGARSCTPTGKGCRRMWQGVCPTPAGLRVLGYSPPPMSLGPLQAVLPEELALAAGVDLGDARRIVSLVHRKGALPERAPATIRRRALDAARALGHVPALEPVERRASAV